MATLNTEIIRILSLLARTNKATVGRVLKRRGDSWVLLAGSRILLEISESSMTLAGKDILDTKLLPGTSLPKHSVIEAAKLEAFFRALSPDVIRLNHLGIGYICPNVDVEIRRYLDLLEGTRFHLYEEPSALSYERWFFVGDRTTWQDPMFEMVITTRPQPFTKDWMPQFQIDLDTDLSLEELEALTDKYLGKGFFKWQFDVKDYGVVLAVGWLGNIGGTKICLDLATYLRNTRWSRQQALQEVTGV